MLRIRDLRERRKMTQEELGKAVSISRENISRYETGQRTPPADKLIKLADALGCSLDELTGRDKAPTG